MKPNVVVIDDWCRCDDLMKPHWNYRPEPKKPTDIDPDTTGLVMFTGGEDIGPSLYGHPNVASSFSVGRDEREKQVFKHCVKYGIPMVGVCRGHQLLNALSGGWLVQHLNGHSGCGGHEMTDVNGETIFVNSMHHQMCIPGPKSKLIAWSDRNLSREYRTAFGTVTSLNQLSAHGSFQDKESEVIAHPHTLSIGFQYHPEFMHDQNNPAVQYFHRTLLKFLESISLGRPQA